MKTDQDEEPKIVGSLDSHQSHDTSGSNSAGDQLNKKYIHPELGELNITENQYTRLEKLLKLPQDSIKWFSLTRLRVVSWISEYLYILYRYTLPYIDAERFEAFLLAAEKVVALRKQKKPMNEIVDVAGDYILYHRLTWSSSSAYEKGYIRFFVGHILWSFFEKYPKYIPTRTTGKNPMKHALNCLLASSDSEIAQLITEICVLIPNVNDDVTWADGKLINLSRRVLGLLKDAKESNDTPSQKVCESGHTISLRLALAQHVDEIKRRSLIAKALKYSKKIYGDYHSMTWDCTERLGNYYLNDASEHTLRYWFSQIQGDRVRAVMGLYEDFLDSAEEHGKNGNLSDTFLETFLSLLREQVVPALAKLYMEHGKDRKARALLWKFTKEISSQLYDENWTPFIGLGKSTRLVSTLRLAEGLGAYSNLKYSTLDVAIFPFDQISLSSVKPSDEEKTRKWHFLCVRLPKEDVSVTKTVVEWMPGLEGGYEAQTIVTTEGAMILELPYITYSHFRSSQAYRMGRTYDYYRKGSMNQPQLTEWLNDKSHDSIIYFSGQQYSEHIDSAHMPSVRGSVLIDPEKGEIERFVYDRETGTLDMTEQKYIPKEINTLLTPRILDATKCATSAAGFFNETPGDIAILDGSGVVANGYNLVSAEWHDWKRFILHPCTSLETQPELISADGSVIPVLGYIYGSWTEHGLRKKWTGLQIWVVHARFQLSVETDSLHNEPSCHFVLNTDDLCKGREHELSATEIRSMCTFLNPSLLRVMNHSYLEPPICTFAQGFPDNFKGVTVEAPEPSKHWNLLAELSFRDSWDTQFAEICRNTYLDPSRLEIIEKQIKEETARRREWDPQYLRVVRHWVRTRT
ncbi:hypothetical protein UA08_00979 [Talaromyces atroroseus]|uniref:Uncharacterized protein n=1 Tax=Talaromyces atroroseus TaxID=1441469 RepID=A0A225B8E0_TALAT|nr:hypothetical protein UA08_00979 [Talaromyces atroroseus]OKL64359.1 hypothetical protein UA08_00979 [Talaromyces atroroseus]